jgi:hypothetical protein
MVFLATISRGSLDTSATGSKSSRTSYRSANMAPFKTWVAQFPSTDI